LRARLPERINVTPKERVFRFGCHLGTAIYNVVIIVAPRTFLRWLHE
jgi:hypothetical protein